MKNIKFLIVFVYPKFHRCLRCHCRSFFFVLLLFIGIIHESYLHFSAEFYHILPSHRNRVTNQCTEVSELK